MRKFLDFIGDFFSIGVFALLFTTSFWGASRVRDLGSLLWVYEVIIIFSTSLCSVSLLRKGYSWMKEHWIVLLALAVLTLYLVCIPFMSYNACVGVGEIMLSSACLLLAGYKRVSIEDYRFIILLMWPIISVVCQL